MSEPKYFFNLQKPIEPVLGVTGTRHGLTAKQLLVGIALLRAYSSTFNTLRHGCCVGADEEIAVLARDIGYRVICHPPIDEKLISVKARNASNIINVPMNYLDRNKAIVDGSHRMLAFPSTMEEAGGGTWYTIRYTRKQSFIPLTIIYPDGSLDDN